MQPAETGRVDPCLDHAEPGRASRVSRADAVRVGWGSLAEDPASAELCADLGVTSVGPPPEAMRLLSAEIEAGRRRAPHEHPDGESTTVGDVLSAEADPEREKALGEVAAEFEAVHDIERARRAVWVHDVVPAAELRPRLTTAVERGTARAGAT